MTLAVATAEHLLQKAGAERVGADGAEEFRRAVEEYALRLGRQANELALHAGRKTVKRADVVLALGGGR